MHQSAGSRTKEKAVSPTSCNCNGPSGGPVTKYELTTAKNPTPRVYLSETEARVNMMADGGGTITPIT